MSIKSHETNTGILCLRYRRMTGVGGAADGCTPPMIPKTERNPLLLFYTSRSTRVGLTVGCFTLHHLNTIGILASKQDTKLNTMSQSNCQSGCCGSSPPVSDTSTTTPCTVEARPEELTTSKAETTPGDDCCGTDTKEGGTGDKAPVGCCSPGTGACTSEDNTPDAVEATANVAVASGTQGGCCAASPETLSPCQGSQAVPAREDPGCAATPPRKENCQDGCCGETQDVPPVAVEPEPPCCEGKQKPCCNDGCIDRIALRECEKSCRGGSQAGGQSNTNGLSSPEVPSIRGGNDGAPLTSNDTREQSPLRPPAATTPEPRARRTRSGWRPSAVSVGHCSPWASSLAVRPPRRVRPRSDDARRRGLRRRHPRKLLGPRKTVRLRLRLRLRAALGHRAGPVVASQGAVRKSPRRSKSRGASQTAARTTTVLSPKSPPGKRTLAPKTAAVEASQLAKPAAKEAARPTSMLRKAYPGRTMWSCVSRA